MHGSAQCFDRWGSSGVLGSPALREPLEGHALYGIHVGNIPDWGWQLGFLGKRVVAVQQSDTLGPEWKALLHAVESLTSP